MKGEQNRMAGLEGAGAPRSGGSGQAEFAGANEQQIKAITAVDGPVLITAGPGTGKTFTLVQRAVHLIADCGLLPENIMIVTFTEKAARELVTRLTNELGRKNITVNLNEMYIGTFHSICLRILKEYSEYTRFGKDYRLLDEFEQKYLVMRNIGIFGNRGWRQGVPGFEELMEKREEAEKEWKKGMGFSVDETEKPDLAWKRAEAICDYVNKLTEEMVDPEDPKIAAKAEGDSDLKVIGGILLKYRDLLEKNHAIDFALSQVETYRLLEDNPKVLEEIRSQISHIMVDEYQDTNYIQELLVFLIAGEKKNICVVGDDDQGLYRFRGATIRNILEFPDKFKGGDRECAVIPLTVNYRSDKGIVDLYNEWMDLPNRNKAYSFKWFGIGDDGRIIKYRHDKQIRPDPDRKNAETATVVKVVGRFDDAVWFSNVYKFIKSLKDSGKIADYNQIAFLVKSVKNQRIQNLAAYLAGKGIGVYSPRSDMFFRRGEIRFAIGCLLLLFPSYVEGMYAENTYAHLTNAARDYYVGCIDFAKKQLDKADNAKLKAWIDARGRKHADWIGQTASPAEKTDFAYTGLLYRMFAYPPFSSILNTEAGRGVLQTRGIRNLAQLTRLVAKFETLHRINAFDPGTAQGRREIVNGTERLFNQFLRTQMANGIFEYEDDSEYAPSGCVSFMTIFQSKGLEFPVVFVDSLSSDPKNDENWDANIEKIETLGRGAYELPEDKVYCDFWRRYYTAFSRAQNLLVLTCKESSVTPIKQFRGIYNELPLAENRGRFDIGKLPKFSGIKGVDLKKSYAYTSHIAVYNACPRQYKFYKELGFASARTKALQLGSLVHETIEDVHRAALRDEAGQITEANIRKWFEANYISLCNAENVAFQQEEKEAALKRVLRYADLQRGKWKAIREAEMNVSLVRPDYILDGNIDLVCEAQDGSWEIVDFKSGRSIPDTEADVPEKYLQQLHVYAHLLGKQTAKKISRMHLYFTDAESGRSTFSFPYDEEAVEKTMAEFDSTVQRIAQKDFEHGAKDDRTCINCDFRFYCGKA